MKTRDHDHLDGGGPTPDWIRRQVLDWYDAHARVLPWRAGPGERADPYHVWISEIMLQQTTVATVTPRFEEFLRRWPRVRDLAAAPLDEVLAQWQGLGYYARARNLHRCAQDVAARLDGQLPATESDLRRLPGIGAYTAAAIAAIAFDRPAVPVDGNVIRLVSRLFAIAEPPPQGPRRVNQLAKPLAGARPGDLAQGLMDLGATICRPGVPRCGDCPLHDRCRARRAGNAGDYPARRQKKDRPRRTGWVYWMENGRGEVWLRRRPDDGLLGGMMEVPSTEWRDEPMSVGQAIAQAPAHGPWVAANQSVSHVFTHFHLTLSILRARVSGDPAINGGWHHPDGFGDLALPTLMKKVVSAATAMTA